MATKKTIEEVEKQESDAFVNDLLSEGKLSEYGEYFASGLDRDGLAYPKNYYDVIVFNAIDHPKYYYGTVGAHALDALKEDGYLIFNANGSAHDMDQVIHIMEFVGLNYQEKEGRDGFYVFQKPKVKNEK